VAVRIAGPGGSHRDLGSNGREEGIGRRGLAAVVRDLEQIDRREALGEQRRVDVLLDVPGQQEAPLTHHPEQHHRHVVDAAAGIRWFGRDLATDGPQHPHRDLVDRQPVSGPDRQAWRRPGSSQSIDPGCVAGSRTAHAGLQDATDPIAIEQQGQPGNMVLVGMREDDRVQPPVPRGDASVELDEEAVRIRPAVDQESTAVGSLDEDRVALTDVEDRDPCHARWPRHDHAAGDRHGDDQGHGRHPAGRGWALPVWPRSRRDTGSCRGADGHPS
jgi:hypothetical protein